MFIFTKISLTIMFMVIIVAIAETYGKLDRIYGTYIIFIGLAIQFIMLIIFILIIFKRRKELNSAIKIIRYKIEDKCIKGDTDILSESITTTNPRKSSIFKIYLEVKDSNEPPDFGMCKTGKGNANKMTDVKKHLLYANAGIVDGLFIFTADMIVRPDEKINFKFKNDTNVKIFFIGELYIP